MNNQISKKNISLGNCPYSWFAKEGGNLKDMPQDEKVPEISGHGIFDASELLWEHISRQDISLPSQCNMEVLQNTTNDVFNLPPHDACPDSHVLVVVHVHPHHFQSQGRLLEQVVGHRDVLRMSQVDCGDHELKPDSLHGQVVVAVVPPQLIPCEALPFLVDQPGQLWQFHP